MLSHIPSLPLTSPPRLLPFPILSSLSPPPPFLLTLPPSVFTDVLLQDVVPRFLGMSRTLVMMLAQDSKAYETLYEGVVGYSATHTSCGKPLDTMDEEHKDALFEVVSVWLQQGVAPHRGAKRP